MDEAESENARIYEASSGVVPQEFGDHGWNDEARDEDKLNVVFVLPFDDLALAQVTNISDARFPAWLQQHPTDMRIPETLVGVVRVEVGIGVTMVCAVTPRPPLDGTLYCSSTRKRQEILKRQRGIVRAMSP